MSASENVSILKVQIVLVDAFRNLQVRLAGVLKELGQILSNCSILIEQQLLEHRLVDRDHLPQIRAGKIHSIALLSRPGFALAMQTPRTPRAHPSSPRSGT